MKKMHVAALALIVAFGATSCSAVTESRSEPRNQSAPSPSEERSALTEEEQISVAMNGFMEEVRDNSNEYDDFIVLAPDTNRTETEIINNFYEFFDGSFAYFAPEIQETQRVQQIILDIGITYLDEESIKYEVPAEIVEMSGDDKGYIRVSDIKKWVHGEPEEFNSEGAEFTVEKIGGEWVISQVELDAVPTR